MSKITDIFGKDYGLNISDIEEAVKSDLILENDEIELTDIDRFMGINNNANISKKKGKLNQKIKIISELIGFLNSGRGIGLLILGLEQKDNTIKIKGVKTFKNIEQVRSSIFGNMGTIPSNIKPFKLNSIPIPMKENKNIFLIEVENNDLNGLYYSKIDNNVYVRRGEETKSLDLPNFLDILSQKNHARIFMKFTQKPDDNAYLFDIMYSNEGIEPGKYIKVIFQIITTYGLNYSIKSTQIKKRDNMEAKISLDQVNKDVYESLSMTNLIGNKLSISQFEGHSGYPPNTMLIYPGLNARTGELSIEKKDFWMQININIFENRSHTRQAVMIQVNNNKVTINDFEKEFKPYLKL